MGEKKKRSVATGGSSWASSGTTSNASNSHLNPHSLHANNNANLNNTVTPSKNTGKSHLSHSHSSTYTASHSQSSGGGSIRNNASGYNSFQGYHPSAQNPQNRGSYHITNAKNILSRARASSLFGKVLHIHTIIVV